MMRITWQNLDTQEYTPAPGIEYEVAAGVTRRLRPPHYDVMRSFMAAMQPSMNGETTDPMAEDEVRMRCLEICTDGDPLPDGWAGVDVAIATRAVADFFTFRIPRPSKPPKS